MSILFSPIRIGEVELKNRIVMPAIHLGMAKGGLVDEKIINFYSSRAQGGVGLIIVGGCGIDDYGNAFGMIQLNEDKYKPDLMALTKEIHTFGAKVFAQLYQAGRYASKRLTGKDPVAPSAIPSLLTREVPKEMEERDIEAVISNFASAAARAKACGFDGVEILGSAGYIISQFLSPITNHRQDQYGGGFHQRLTLPIKIVEAVRNAVGADFPIIVRIAGNDFMKGSNTNKEAVVFAKALEAAGVDGINVTGGWHETRVPQLTMNVPKGAFAYLVKNIKRNVSIPVIGSNRLNDPILAVEVLQDGIMDLIGMARPLIADPELPKKLQEGSSERIRPCIACNQGCLDRIFSLRPVECCINFDDSVSSNQQKSLQGSLLVIGGGPAGLEFARQSRMLGYDVTLWEKEARLGGQLLIAAQPPGRQDFLDLVKWYEVELERLGVQTILNREATKENVIALCTEQSIDKIVVATGAKPLSGEKIKGHNSRVVQSWDFLRGNIPLGRRVVVLGGGAVGVETALKVAKKGTMSGDHVEFLLREGAESYESLRAEMFSGTKEVTLIEMEGSVGKDIGLSTRWSMLQDLERFGVKVLTKTTVEQIEEEYIVVSCQEGTKKLEYDTAILALGSQPNNSLYLELLKENLSVRIIGDASSIGKVPEAIGAGYHLAHQI